MYEIISQIIVSTKNHQILKKSKLSGRIFSLEALNVFYVVIGKRCRRLQLAGTVFTCSISIVPITAACGWTNHGASKDWTKTTPYVLLSYDDVQRNSYEEEKAKDVFDDQKYEAI